MFLSASVSDMARLEAEGNTGGRSDIFANPKRTRSNRHETNNRTICSPVLIGRSSACRMVLLAIHNSSDAMLRERPVDHRFL